MSQGKWQKGKVKGDGEILTHEETMKILSELARNGSVTAVCSLERALRAQARAEAEEGDELDRAINDILTK